MTDRFKEIAKENDIPPEEMAELLDLTYGSYRVSISNGQKVPRWVKSAMIFYNLGFQKSAALHLEVIEETEINK